MASRDERAGFEAGLVAGVAAGVVMVAGRIALGVPTIPEIVLDRATILVPPAVFSLILENLAYMAKPLIMAIIVVGQLIASGGLGALYERWGSATRATNGLHPAIAAGGLAFLLWLIAVLGVLPLLNAGLFGSNSVVGPMPLMTTLFVAALAYSISLHVALGVQLTRPGAAAGVPDLGRRRFLRLAGWGAVGLAVSAFLLRGATLLVASADAVRSSRRPANRMTPEVTPADDFYVVSKNLVDPVVDPAEWRLEIVGLVARPMILSYSDLTTLPATEQYATLECISNEIGGTLISNALWKGIAFPDLLALAEPLPGVRKVILTGVDGYDDSISLERAKNPANLLAWDMNGERLTPAHGFPARLIVPGTYGIKNVKWLTKITLVDHDFRGYWQQRGWSEEAIIKTTSRIDLPPDLGTYPAGPLVLGGIAFSGDREIAAVEVSFDSGKTWERGIVKKALSPYAWALWMTTWDAPPGRHRLFVRAVDGTGLLQTGERVDTLPDGASGHHTIVVQIEE